MFDKNAIINLNKPTGMSSFLAVKKVARLLGVKKAGHMGTLDDARRICRQALGHQIINRSA